MGTTTIRCRRSPTPTTRARSSCRRRGGLAPSRQRILYLEHLLCSCLAWADVRSAEQHTIMHLPYVARMRLLAPWPAAADPRFPPRRLVELDEFRLSGGTVRDGLSPGE